jgi:hypothetical protein
MMKKTPFLFTVFLLCFLVSSVFAQTQGTLEAYGKQNKQLGDCSLKHRSVKADISGFLARVSGSKKHL